MVLVTYNIPFRLLIGPIFMITKIFSGLASMLCSELMKLSKMPNVTLKMNFSGSSLMLNRQKLVKVSSSSAMS